MNPFFAAAVLLLLLSFTSHALIRKSATPILHSVADRDSPRNAAASTYTNDDGFGQRIASGPTHMPSSLLRYRTPPETWRRRGIGFTIAGGSLLLIGAGCWAASDAETARQQANGGRSYTLPYYLGSALILALGLVFLAIGLPIWLTHLR